MREVVSLAGAVLCTGVPGSVLTDDVRAALAALAPGGIVLFARNVTTLEDTRAFVTALREAAGSPAPLVCVDQEGGRVARLRFAEYGLPAMMALGATRDERLAERAGAQLARELRSVGAEVDFAPVLDLALEPRSTVVGTRSLGADPARVALLGAALVRGLQREGVVAAPKHFPGHGATGVDSHLALPVIDSGVAVLRTRELVPFQAAFAAGARAVMSAHVMLPALDAERPATLSPAILRDLLRGELGFRGVCFTDCLQMDAVARSVGSARAAVLALGAGADMVVVSNDLDLAARVRDTIVAAVEDGELPLERLEEAVARIARLREPQAIASAREARDAGLALEIARRAVTVLRGDPRLAPERAVTVVSFEGESADGIASNAGKRPSLSLALRRRRVRSEVMRVGLEPDASMREMLLDVLRAQGERDFVAIARRAHLHPAQQRALEALFAFAPDAIAVSALEPFDVTAMQAAKNVVCTFGDDEANVEALADVLTGRGEASGTLPVVIEPASPRV